MSVIGSKSHSPRTVKIVNKTMSSFQKKKSSCAIPGTKISLQNGQPLTSTGNSYFDALIGGGLAIGSLLLIEEDKYGAYSDNLSKYFLTEGVVNNHSAFVVNLDDDPDDFIQKLPQVCKVESDEKSSHRITSDRAETNDMRIAWRYNALPSIDTSQKSLTYFDSSKRIDSEMLANADIELFKEAENPTENCFHNPIYGQILANLKNKLDTSTFSTNESSVPNDTGKNLLRISISSLGSPLWYDDGLAEDVCLFLFLLKALVRSSIAVGCVTVPSHLFRHLDDSLIHRIRNLVDYSIELESFAGSDKETNPIFKDYHGLLFIRKLSALNSLAAYTPATRDLVFKLKRKNFVIEKLHLPPELQEPDAKPDAVPSISCGSSTKKLLDF